MQQNVPSPEGYGWIKSGEAWMPVWTLLPEAAKASRELLKCCCKAKPLCSRMCNVMMMQGSLVQPCVNVVDCVNLDSEFPIFLFSIFAGSNFRG